MNARDPKAPTEPESGYHQRHGQLPAESGDTSRSIATEHRVGEGEVSNRHCVEASGPVPTEEWLRLEYEHVNHRWINGTNQRRVGMAFFTTTQGALLGLIGEDVLHLTAKGVAFDLFGILITTIAWNNERRIGAYMAGYMVRLLEIEQRIGLRMTTYGRDAAVRHHTISNRRLFAIYFLLILVWWVGLLIYNIVVLVEGSK